MTIITSYTREPQSPLSNPFLPMAALTLSRVNHVGIRLDQLLSRRPLFYGVLIPTASAVASDLLVQLTSNRMADHHCNRYYYGFGNFGPSRSHNYLHNLLTLDLNRTAVFATFGVCYLGGFNYLIYAKLMDRVVGRLVNPNNIVLSRGIKMAYDSGIHIPFMYFPTFFFIKDRFIDNDRPSSHSPGYRLPSLEDLRVSYSFWLPVQFVTFSIASYWRLPWMAAANFVWNSILSARSMG